MVKKGNGNRGFKLLRNNCPTVFFHRWQYINSFHEKQSASQIASDEVLMSWENPCVHPVLYESNDEDLGITESKS